MSSGKYLVPVFAGMLIASIQSNAQNNTVYNAGHAPQTATELSAMTADNGYSLPWAQVMENDIAWKKRVWRYIDVKAAGNAPFVTNSAATPGNSLPEILGDGLKTGKYKAYNGMDGRFLAELELAEKDLNAAKVDREQVVGYKIKEDWLFLKAENKIVVRILGIAPVVRTIAADGSTNDNAAYWLYYPDVRGVLAAHKVTINGKDATGQNWDQLFEGRKFSSAINKVTDLRAPTQPE
jgi:gliding motility associated protien GldN